MPEQDPLKAIARITTNPKLMLWVIFICGIIIGFVSGSLYVCSGSEGTLLPNLDCVIEKSLDYCVFDGKIYQKTPDMMILGKNLSFGG